MGKSDQLAKLTRPRSTKLLKRERLFSQLDALTQSGCVWIAAPAGAGKTSLVASYLDERKRKGLWYQVDQGDGDLASFFYYLGLAATASAPKKKPFSLLLTPEYLPNLQFFIRRYFRELFQSLPSNAVLVLDNFQEAATSLAVVVDVLCDEVPEGASVIVMSRQSTPGALARHVANGKLVALNADELKTNVEETREIMGANCSEAMLRLVQNKTTGWAAGVVLMREHLRSSASVTNASVAESPSSIFDYFAGELLAKLDENAHNFLLRTAPLSNITVATANAASGMQDAQYRLEDLHKNNVFTYRHDGTAHSYQYHPLFREFLNRQLRREMSAEQLHELLLTCARTCVAHNESEVAAELLVEAQAWGELVPLILNHANTLLNQGRWRTLQNWINHVPKPVRDEVAWLTFWSGMTHMQLNQGAAIDAFERAFAQFKTQADPIGQVVTCAAAIATYFFQLDSVVGVTTWLEHLEPHLESETVLANPSIALRATSAAALGACLSRPDFPLQAHCLTVALKGLEDPQISVQDKLLPGLMLMFCCAAVGDVASGNRTYAWIKPYLEAEQIPSILRAFASAFAAYFLILKGEDEIAFQHIGSALALSEREGIAPSLFEAAYFQVFAHAVNGRLAEVEVCLPTIHTSVDRARCIIETQYLWGIGKWHLLRKEYGDATETFAQSLKVAERSGMIYVVVLASTMLAICQTKIKDWAAAARSLDGVQRLIDGNVYQHMRPLARLIRASGALQQGYLDEARLLVNQGLEALDESNVLAIPRCPTFAMPEIFAFMLRESPRTELVRKLIRQLRIAPVDLDDPRWPWPVKISTFGRFSIEINDTPASFGRKAPKKDLALLKLLVGAGPKGMHADQIVDHLWPDSDGDRAMNALTQGLHRLRTLLKDHYALRASGGVIELNREKVWVDAWAFEALCQRAATLNGDKGILHAHARNVLELYQGHFLSHDAEPGLIVKMRERLRNKFVEQIVVTANHLEQLDETREALDLFRSALEIDESAEALYEGALRCSLALGSCADGLALYERLQNVATTQWRREPSKTSRALREQLLQNHS